MGIEALDKLGEALAALEAVDVSSLSDEQLHELCIGTHKACQRLGASCVVHAS